jgi:branched-subunit amino acid transport protein
MSQPLLWTIVIITGLLTLLIRLSFIALLGNIHIPTILQQALRFVPVAVLSAIIAPALFFPNGSLSISLSNSRLIAGAVAVLVAWRTKNVLLTIVIGMACLLILQLLSGWNPLKP